VAWVGEATFFGDAGIGFGVLFACGGYVIHPMANEHAMCDRAFSSLF
jgi:hypothetical protein